MTPSLDNCPALVLNADYRPLSYFPLSLWAWQDSVKAVFLERVDIVSEYDRKVHSPGFEMRVPSVVALKRYVARARRPAFTRCSTPTARSAIFRCRCGRGRIPSRRCS